MVIAHSINKNKLISLFLIAFIIRLLFDFYFQQFYFGKFVFKYGDSLSYLNPILNLINHGVYMGDLQIEDSKYFRVPVYPSFLGAIYLITGSGFFDYAVAIIQALIDSLSTVLVYLILYKVTNSLKTAFFSGLLYATYPFVIVWNPISYTEVFQIFFLFLLLYVSLQKDSYLKYFFQGILIALLVLTKQYLGLLILIPFFSYLLDKKKVLKQRVIALSIVIMAFLIGMAPWVVRNYIVSDGKLIVLKGDSTGLPIYGKDFEAFEKFANLFNENITPVWTTLSYSGKYNLGLYHKDFVNRHKKEIDYAFQKAYECGPSFIQRRRALEPGENLCEQEVIDLFHNLTLTFWKEVSFKDAMQTRVDSFLKIFSKNEIVSENISFSKTEFIKKLLFKYRVFLIFFGLISLFYLLFFESMKFKSFLVSIIITAITMYFFFSFVIVHTEIRYLLVPDLLLSIFAPIIFIRIYEKIVL